MLSWLQAREDVQHVLEYQKNLEELWRHENEAAKAVRCGHGQFSHTAQQHERQRLATSADSNYQVVRDKVARATPRMEGIASRNGILALAESYPAPAAGGLIIETSLFGAVLYDNSHVGIEPQMIVDAVNQTRGAAIERVGQEFRKLFNPFHWLKEALVFLIRIPFLAVEATGFSTRKVEDHFIGKLFKFIELGVLLWIAFRLGLTKEDLTNILVRLFG